VLALYSPEVLDQLGLAPDHNERVQTRNFHGMDLRGAHLVAADLEGFDLSEARLDNADLATAGLHRANLRGAVLCGAQLEGAQLQGGDLTRADLHGAGLNGAGLEGAKLREADLQDADLAGAVGLQAGQLAGANVSNAKLPEAVGKFEGLGQVEELSKNAGKLFLAMLGACAYCCLTLYSTKDTQLLTNSLGTKLPIIETEVPIVWFYLVAPLVVLGLYLYHHLYLQRLWEGLAELPAVFPDGKTVDERTYPWLLNGLVYVYFEHLRELRPALWRLQQWLSILTAWCTVPLTLFLFWGRHLRRHQGGETHLLIALLAISVWAGVEFYRLAATTLRHGKTRPGRAENRFGPFVKRQWPTLIAVLSGFLFANLSDNAINGVPPSPATSTGRRAAPLRRWVPQALALIGCNPFGDFRDADVSTKPATWTGTTDPKKQSEEIALVKGAQLRDAQLQHLDAYGVFLVKADLQGADLRGADLQRAQLQKANLLRARKPHRADARLRDVILEEADLQGATLAEDILAGDNLRRANLQWADLTGADLTGADLAWARLTGAHLTGAHLTRSNLFWAHLTGAHLDGADLTGAHLNGANLSGADLTGANLSGADLTGANLTRTALFDANLTRASLFGANLNRAALSEANLGRANLGVAYLRGANLTGASLREANLTRVNLTQADLSGADLTGAHFMGAQYNDQTHWPQGFQARDHGAVRVKERASGAKGG